LVVLAIVGALDGCPEALDIALHHGDE